MKTQHYALWILLLFWSVSFAQRSSEIKVNARYGKYGVRTVTEYFYSYSGLSPCDSTPRLVQSYNDKGQLIKEEFPRGRWKNYYTYEYNAEGFLINIDSTGLFGFGYASGSNEDTIFQEIQESWILFDTTRRITQRIFSNSDRNDRIITRFEYNDKGRLMKEIYCIEEDSKVVCDSSCEYEYDLHGFLRKQIHRDTEGITLSIRETVYDYVED